MNRNAWSALALTLGVLLIGASWLAPRVVPKGALWNEANAAEFVAASEEFHDHLEGAGPSHRHSELTQHLGHGHEHHDHDEASAAGERYQTALAKLESAQSFHDRLPTKLRWCGFALCVLGAVGHYAGKRE
ncbi:MAG: hypothetical protein KF847_01450 [Pirellulales bacterium]|nr:hypothetical protein [Pirellulales bacterium]